MLINRAYRYELKPNALQRQMLAQHAGTARFAYNWGLAQRIEMYEKDKKQTNAIEQHKHLNSLKETLYPWMYEVSKCAPQEALRDLDKAFKNFFRGFKNSHQMGFPTFKKKGIKDSFRLTGTIKIKDKEIQLPRLGRMRLKERSQVQGRILSATISRSADRWFVSLGVELTIDTPTPVEGERIGIDVGLQCFATLSSGEKVLSPKPLKKQIRRLRRYSKQHSHKVCGSNNCKKAALKLARLHRKVHHIRQDFLHQLTTKLAKTKSVIVIEDLDIRGLIKKGNYSLSIHDASFSEFRRQLTYKTKWYGSQLVVAPRFYPSSKRCSSCGILEAKMPLFVRQWICKQCGTTHDRDVNAAKNLLNLCTGSSPETHACGDTSCGASQQLASNVSEKQELISGIFVHKL